MKLTHRLIGLTLTTALVSGLVAAAPAAAQDTIKIGVIYDFAGACHMYSEAGVKGIKMAVEEINGAGGILGCKLEMKMMDEELRPATAVKNATPLNRA